MSEAPPAVANMLNFIRRYEGGSCFLVSAISITADKAVIDSFSMSHGPTDAFDAAFRSETGLNADVIGQGVSKAQCGAVDFLRQARGDEDTAPILQIDRSPLHTGDILSGTVRKTGERNVTLLLVSETGEVENLTKGLKGGGAGSFSIRLERLAPERLVPQLLLAITSSVPLPVGDIPSTGSADNFRHLSEAVARSDLALEASGKLFLFSR